MDKTIEAPAYPLFESLWVTVRGGLTEALQPGGIALLLVFLIVLFCASRLGVLRRAARVFILTVVILKIPFFLGIFDPFLSWDFVNQFWDVCYLLIAGGSLFLGLVFFRDWMVLGRKEDFSALKISPPRDRGEDKKLPLSGMAAVAAVAALAVVIQVSWPPDAEAAYRLFSTVHYGRWGRLLSLLGLYAGAFVLPLAVLWKSWQYAVAGTRDFFYVYWSKCLVVCSALFIGYGLSILWYFIPF